MTAPRHYSPLDRLIIEGQRALGTTAGKPTAERSNPAAAQADVVMNESARRHAAGLMRINHTGEVCAQALYVGQAAVAHDETTRNIASNKQFWDCFAPYSLCFCQAHIEGTGELEPREAELAGLLRGEIAGLAKG